MGIDGGQNVPTGLAGSYNILQILWRVESPRREGFPSLDSDVVCQLPITVCIAALELELTDLPADVADLIYHILNRHPPGPN